MKKHNLLLFKLLFFILSCVLQLNAQVKPIALHPVNPHYFVYNGKPTILITSGEHYGAVMNPDFNYKIYLKTLQKDGLNLTRTMTGGYFEPSGAFNISKNTLAPDQQKYLCPWQRVGDGSKFDLTKWDEAYFTRLKDFVVEAKKHDVIVELSLFCPFYEEMQWKLSPFNILNNVNNLGDIPRTDVYTLDKNKGLLEVQEAMVRKLVEELRDCPNVIYEICNEPYFGGITLEWQGRIAQVITEAEKNFVQHHLISQNIANGSQKITNPNPLVSVFNFHFPAQPTPSRFNIPFQLFERTFFCFLKISQYQQIHHRQRRWHFPISYCTTGWRIGCLPETNGIPEKIHRKFRLCTHETGYHCLYRWYDRQKQSHRLGRNGKAICHLLDGREAGEP